MKNITIIYILRSLQSPVVKRDLMVECYTHQILTIRENTTCNEGTNENERGYNVNFTSKVSINKWLCKYNSEKCVQKHSARCKLG